MSHSNRQTVPYLPGFQCFVINNRSIPDPYILSRLLRPNIDPRTVILEVSSTLDSEEETQSQQILREHNNWIVSHLVEESMPENNDVLRSLCEKMDRAFEELEVSGIKGFPLNFDMLRYHVAKMNYLDYFFLPPPNYDETPKDLAEVSRDYQRYIKSGKWESKVVQKYLNSSEKIKRKIRQIFPDYEESESCHKFFIETALRYFPNEFAILHVEKSAGFAEIRDISRKNYRQPIEERLVKYPIPWQCQFCHKWDEREQTGNGKMRVKCDACFRAWDRNRRRKKKSVILK